MNEEEEIKNLDEQMLASVHMTEAGIALISAQIEQLIPDIPPEHSLSIIHAVICQRVDKMPEAQRHLYDLTFGMLLNKFRGKHANNLITKDAYLDAWKACYGDK
jgi:hypothetical protein